MAVRSCRTLRLVSSYIQLEQQQPSSRFRSGWLFLSFSTNPPACQSPARGKKVEEEDVVVVVDFLFLPPTQRTDCGGAPRVSFVQK